MQISAANLLLAGQQLRHGSGRQAAGDAFARALAQGGTNPGKTGQIASAPFLPPDFAAETGAATPVSQTGTVPAGSAVRPGSRLDIRV